MLWLLADLGVERNANTERGLIVLAIIACLLSAISILRWWLKPPAIRPTRDEEKRGWPFVRRTLTSVLQIVCGLFAVFLLATLTTPKPQRPAGWSLISPPNEVGALALLGDTIWAGGREGVFAVDRKTGRLLETPLGSRDLRGVRTLRAEGAELWIGCTAGLFRWNGTQLEKSSPPAQPDTGPITALTRVRDGSLWIGATQGVWHRTGDQWHWFGAAEGLRLPTVDSIFEDRNGVLWFASKEPESPGLWKLEGGKWSLFDRSHGLPHTAINDIVEDHAGTLWFACGFGGAGAAHSLVDGRLSPAEPVQGLEGKKIRSLFADSKKRFWFCSEYDGVAIRDGTTWRRLTMREGLPGNEIKVMLEEPDGTLWLGNERGLGRIEAFK